MSKNLWYAPKLFYSHWLWSECGLCTVTFNLIERNQYSTWYELFNSSGTTCDRLSHYSATIICAETQCCGSLQLPCCWEWHPRSSKHFEMPLIFRHYFLTYIYLDFIWSYILLIQWSCRLLSQLCPHFHFVFITDVLNFYKTCLLF